MVDKKLIEDALYKSIHIVKCGDYPKAKALREYNENPSRFKTEQYDTNPNQIPSPIGRLQKIQEDLQSNVEYEELEKGVAHAYSTNDFTPINDFVYKKKGWDRPKPFHSGIIDRNGGFEKKAVLNGDEGWAFKTVPEEIELLDSLIEKSPPLQEDTVLYRYGSLPEGIEIGGHGRMEGYMSSSYNEYVAFDDIPNNGTWNMGDNRFKLRIFAPKGTKGVVIDENLECMDWQSEFLIGRKQKFILLNMDNEKGTADILLY